MSQEEALNQFKTEKSSYVIFEKEGNLGHFYITYSGGLRHFTVNDRQIAGIDNGGAGYFPSLYHLI